MRHIN